MSTGKGGQVGRGEVSADDEMDIPQRWKVLSIQ